ncbi:MAG: hypothetical protein ACPGVD_06275 [Flavobacteriales bacterium]
MKNKGVIIIGFIWGGFMVVFCEILDPLVFKESFSLKSILISIPFWLIGGFIFGYIMKLSLKADDNQ